MKKLETPRALLSLIKKEQVFFLMSHKEPDGDCIGSSLGLGYFLQRIGKKVYFFNPGPFDRQEILNTSQDFLPRVPDTLKVAHPDAPIIVLDCSTLDRIGDLGDDIHNRRVAVIDHHTSGDEFGDIRFINSTAPSASLLVQQIIEDLGYTPTKVEADAIFFGFCTDTGFFRHLDDQSALAFAYVSRLVAAGATPKEMFYKVSGGKKIEAKRHLGLLLTKMKDFHNGKIILVKETEGDTQTNGRENRESDSFYQQLMSVETVEVIIILREDGSNTVTGGIRSRKYVDVGKIAKEMGGGGHQRAAGFLYNGTLDETEQKILPLIIKALTES